MKVSEVSRWWAGEMGWSVCVLTLEGQEHMVFGRHESADLIFFDPDENK